MCTLCTLLQLAAGPATSMILWLLFSCRDPSAAHPAQPLRRQATSPLISSHRSASTLPVSEHSSCTLLAPLAWPQATWRSRCSAPCCTLAASCSTPAVGKGPSLWVNPRCVRELARGEAGAEDTEQNRTEQNRTEQNRTEQNRTEQNRTEQNRTEADSCLEHVGDCDNHSLPPQHCLASLHQGQAQTAVSSTQVCCKPSHTTLVLSHVKSHICARTPTRVGWNHRRQDVTDMSFNQCCTHCPGTTCQQQLALPGSPHPSCR
jgi:hypothetical protein